MGKRYRFALADFDLVQNQVLNSDETLTIYAKVTNTITNDEVIVEKNIDNIDVSVTQGNIFMEK